MIQKGDAEGAGWLPHLGVTVLIRNTELHNPLSPKGLITPIFHITEKCLKS